MPPNDKLLHITRLAIPVKHHFTLPYTIGVAENDYFKEDQIENFCAILYSEEIWNKIAISSESRLGLYTVIL